MKGKLFLLMVSLVVLLSSLSCVTSGPAFQQEELEDDYGLVYIYRPFSLFGAALHLPITINKIKIFDLYTDGYTVLRVAPQKILIYAGKEWADLTTSNQDVEYLSIEAGKQYFIKIEPTWGAAAPNMTIMVHIPAKIATHSCESLPLFHL